MLDIPKPRRQSIELNLSPLIDVIFILLIFVVLVAKFIDQNQLDIDVPDSEAGRPVALEALVINVAADGLVLIGDEEVPDDAIETRLRALKSKHERVVLMADSAVTLQKGVTVLTAAKKAGFDDVSIATEEPK